MAGAEEFVPDTTDLEAVRRSSARLGRACSPPRTRRPCCGGPDRDGAYRGLVADLTAAATPLAA